MTLQEASKYITNELQKIYAQREAQNICNILLEEITTLTTTERLINKGLQLTILQLAIVEDNLQQLLQHQPIQQIIGYTWFGSKKFLVNKNVLIPRPETEELVQAIALENKGKKTTILDIGTGSGCIAILLKHLLPQATVTAIDISNKALEVARLNASTIVTEITFIQLDFLNDDSWKSLPQFDIIVSNPPYIKEIEKQGMNNNVLQYEPHLALFVPNDDALIFYKKIAAFAKLHLKKDGNIWVEINEMLASETAETFANNGFHTIIKKDMQGKDRITKAYYGESILADT